jgi:hypothetical protein
MSFQFHMIMSNQSNLTEGMFISFVVGHNFASNHVFYSEWHGLYEIWGSHSSEDDDAVLFGLWRCVDS